MSESAMQRSVLAGKKILLVDDESLFSSSVREGLEALESSLQVFEACDGIAALEVLDAHEVNVVVSDIRMPRLDGVGLLTEMLNRALDVPVILLSAFRNAENTQRATGMGAVSFLDKPVDYDALIEAIHGALQPRQRSVMRGFALASLLQLVNVDRKSTTLAVHSRGIMGRIFVREGEVIDAWIEDASGHEAFCEIMGLEHPTLELSPLPKGVRRRIKQPLSTLLLEAFREAQSVRGFGDIDSGWNEVIDDLAFDDLGAAEPATPEVTRIDPAKVECSLRAAGEIKGALGVALVDYASGTTLGMAGQDAIDLEVAAVGNVDVVRAKMRVMEALGIAGEIEDILITLHAQYHLIRPVTGTTLFLYLAIDIETGNLAMARRRLASLEANLQN